MGISKKAMVLSYWWIPQEKPQVIEHGRYKKLLRQYKGTDRYKNTTGSMTIKLQAKKQGVTIQNGYTLTIKIYEKEGIRIWLENTLKTIQIGKWAMKNIRNATVHIATKKIVYTETLLDVCLSLMAV